MGPGSVMVVFLFSWSLCVFHIALGSIVLSSVLISVYHQDHKMLLLLVEGFPVQHLIILLYHQDEHTPFSPSYMSYIHSPKKQTPRLFNLNLKKSGSNFVWSV